jgi:pectinesterase
MCTASAVSTATRPQLTATQATSDTILRYLAQTGTLGALTTDNWNPTAGLGDPAAFPGDLVVAADGSGTHRTVQAALTAATGTARRYILVRPGTYPEKVAINTATPITIYGTGPATQVTIVAAQSANDAGGTAQSATMTVRNNNFQMMNLTVSNDFATPATGTNIQAVALYTTGDRIVMQNVRLHGFQDTLYIDSPSATTVARVYIKGGFIEGDTDFIFGRSTTVIDGSTINYLSSRKGTGSGVHLAPSTSVANNYGFLVVSSTFTGDAAAPANRISLGRSWDQSSTTPTPNGQAVVRDSILGAHINRSAPWAAAATSGRAFSATGNRFFEYCNSGPGAAP